ncbi:PorT family protein [Chryseobacterium paludis]|uniref:PorT family protein n=1 Tax=Chryseobacterium paludis TaxID=2956784 RepID=UPI0021BF6B96|nr:PorT family protein [Chryseobacterium paludis]
MNNQWLNELRRKMEDHTSDVPDELWNDIKDELSFEEEKNTVVGFPTEGSRSDEEENQVPAKKIKPLVYRVAGIAAAIALFFIIGKQLLKVDNEKEVAPKMTYSPEQRNKIKQDHLSNNGTIPVNRNGNVNIDHDVSNKIGSHELASLTGNIFQNSLYQNLGRNPDMGYNKETTDTSLLPYLLGQSGTIIQKQIPHIEDNGSINRRDEINELISETDLEMQNQSMASTAKLKKQRANRSWMLSMLTGKASSESQQFPGYATMSGQPLSISEMWSASAYDNDPFVGVLLANQNKNVEATLRHKVPLNLGISLYYNLGKRWGIGTGLNYTKLSSELHSGSQSNFVKSEQTVHYIGIPVQVNYNVIQKGRFTGYITGGALVEKSVAGNFTTKYVVDNVVNEETKEDLPSQPVQVSLNTALGVQLKLVDKIGVYAEPGVGYHFKDNSSLNTIYKEKPLNLNIKFGIRILLD